MEATGSGECYIYRPGNPRNGTHAQGSPRSLAPYASRMSGHDHQQIQLLSLRSQLRVLVWYLWHLLTIVWAFDFGTCEMALSGAGENMSKRMLLEVPYLHICVE
jgi:hypothetical protein